MKDKKIMLVEDEFFLAEMIKLRLESDGYIVSYAENGKQALELLAENPVDLIVMDQVMPEMDGVTATQHIKQDPKLKHIPVVFLSALSRKTDVDRAKAAGAEDYLIKPFEFEDLFNKIKHYL